MLDTLWRLSERFALICSLLSTASVLGNGKIELSCQGELSITKVTLNDVPAFTQDIAKFNKFCKSNTKTTEQLKECSVSMNLVLGVKLLENEFTELEYSCEEKLQLQDQK